MVQLFFAETLKAPIGRSADDVRQGAQGEIVPVDSQAGNLTTGDTGHHRFVTKRFPLVNIGKMHFDDGNLQHQQRITNCNAGMGKGARIDNQSIDTSGAVLNGIDEGSFMITLEALYGQAPPPTQRFHLGIDLLQ
jgi:hypothetical protein